HQRVFPARGRECDPQAQGRGGARARGIHGRARREAQGDRLGLELLDAPRERRILGRREEAQRDPAARRARSQARDSGRDRFGARHRCAQDRGPDRRQAAAPRQRDGAGDALLPHPHPHPARRRARAGGGPDRQDGREGPGTRAGREGVRLAPDRKGGGVSATDRYVADFKAFAGNGAAGAPSWLKQLREGAITRFAELGFPTTKQEEWRFTSVAPIVDTPFSHPASRIPHPGLSEIGALLIGAGPDGPTVSHPRSLVVIEPGAEVAVVETYAGLGDAVYWSNAVTEIVVGQGARAELYRVQREGRQGLQVATTHSRQERDSFLGVHVVTLGAALARHDITSVLDGAGAELVLNGLYLLSAAQHADHHTVIDHAQPHCASHEYFNGVLAERAHGVFNGRTIVRPGAQRTDSKQTNNNLLLSTEARADSQPQLEIYADDVKCTHGSTVGPLDQTALYYLRSRGLSPETARSLVTYGFAAEILGRMQRPDVRERLDGLVRAGLA